MTLRQQLADLYPVKGSFNVGDSKKKWQLSIIAGILFLMLSSPTFYFILNRLTHRACDANGVPTILGLAMASILFVLIFRYVVRA